MPPSRGGEIRLGGEIRTIRYTAGALRKLQRRRDGEPLTGTVMSIARISIEAITLATWAGLLHEDKDLTVEEVEEWIEPPIKNVISAIMKGLEPWTQTPDEDEEDEAAVGTGEGPEKKGDS